jgi:hypothetical protein
MEFVELLYKQKMSRLLILIFLISNLSVYSQMLPGDVKTTSKLPRSKESGMAGGMYAGLAMKGANTLDNWGLDIGVQLGGMVSDRFGIGAGFYTLFTQNIKINPNQPYFLRLTYGGVEPTFIFKFSNFAFHGKALLALGFAGYSENVNFDVLSDLDGDWVFIAEPSIGLSYIIADSYWITFDAGWRSTGGVDFKHISAQDLSGQIISLSFKTFLD